jgi:hypothetical protein
MRVASVAWGIVAAGGLVVAQSASEGDQVKARLLAAIDSGNPRQIAALVKYPIRVRHGMLAYPIPVQNQAAMVDMVRLFFTPELRCAIEESRVPRPGQPKPRYAMLVADGVVSLADGRVVAERTPQGYRITRLDVIGNAAGPNPKPRDVLFPYGLGQMMYSGRLATDGVDGYVVTARAGDLLQVKTERFPGRALQIRVTDERSGAVLKGASTEFSRLWATRLPGDGRYRIDIVRRAAYCEPAVTYLVTIGLER